MIRLGYRCERVLGSVDDWYDIIRSVPADELEVLLSFVDVAGIVQRKLQDQQW